VRKRTKTSVLGRMSAGGHGLCSSPDSKIPASSTQDRNQRFRLQNDSVAAQMHPSLLQLAVSNEANAIADQEMLHPRATDSKSTPQSKGELESSVVNTAFLNPPQAWRNHADQETQARFKRT
jgi:hypothetical protein